MKKKLLCVLLVCLFLVLAAVGVFLSKDSENQEIPVAEETAVKLYWNIDRKEFVGDSTAGMNKREREADGFYSVRFAVNGEQVTYKVEKARLVEEIDSMDIMGLEIDDQGVITAVYDPKDITGGEVASMHYVVIASDTTLTVSADEALEEDYKMFDITENTGIYNVTGMDPVGHVDTPITSDRIRAFKNEEGEITDVFIVERYGYWPGETVSKYCEHCDAEVEWRVWEEKYTLPTDSAHWVLENKVQISAQHKLEANRAVILDLNGKTVTGPDGKRVYAMTGENAFLAILDSSEEGTGKIVGTGAPDNGGVIYVRYGTFELYGGTIDASEIATVQYASAVRVNNDCVFNMYGGKIIGGKVVAPENKEDKVTNAGYGGTLYVTGTMNMYDGVITGGSCIESGGNIFVGKAGTLNLHGGQISGGYASKKGGNIAGTGKVNIYAATISGGKAKTYGGNFFVGKGGVVTLADDAALVSGGSAKQGGNIYIENGAAVNVNAGTLKFGHSYAHGGSIAVYGECYVGAGKVLNGNATEQGGNIFVGKAGVLTVNGAYVQDGTAGTKGGNIAGTGKVNLKDGAIIGGEAKDYGGNFFSGKGANVNITGDWAVIKNGKAKQGGNSYIENGATVTMTSGWMEAGEASAHGGSIAVYGVLNIEGGTITGNTAQEQGGNIFVGKAGTLNIKGGTVEKGAGTKGGNLAGTGTINLIGGKISDGAADNGGNLYVSGNITMSGGTISGGTAVKGGSVFMDGAADPGAQFTMSGGVIKGGKATGTDNFGGCVYLTRTAKDGATTGTAHFTMTGGEISGGSAKRGGNVFVGRDCSFVLEDGRILNGDASTDVGGNINVTGKLLVSGGSIEGGKAKQGGNVYVAAGSGSTPAAAFELSGGTIGGGEGTTTGGNLAALGEFTMTGGSITGGICNVSGDHKYAFNVYTKPGADGCTFTMTGGTIAGGVRVNASGAIALGGTAQITGSAEVPGLTFSNGSMTIVEGKNFTEEAEIYVSAIKSNPFCTGAKDTDAKEFVVAEGYEVINEDGKLSLVEKKEEGEDPQPEIIDWTSTTTLPTESGHYRLTGDVKLSKAASVADNNTVILDLNGFNISGTNIRIFQFTGSGATLTITNSKGTGGVIKPTRAAAQTSDAGVVYLRDPGNTFNLEGGILDGSGIELSGKNGGVVYVGAGSTFNMSGGTITGGTAKQGGNVYVQSNATFEMSGGTIEKGNGETGGNVAALGKVTIEGGTIKGGTTSGNATGANLYTAPNGDKCTFTMTGGTIEGLVRANGTGVVTLGGTAKISGGETNLTLTNKPAKIETAGFENGAEISVNLEYDAFESDFGKIGKTGDEKYIKLDNAEGLEIAVENGNLYVQEVKEVEPFPGYTKWEATDSLPTAEGKYYLSDNVNVASVTEVAANVTLQLNGMTINGNSATQIYNIKSGGTLTIEGTGTVTGGKAATGNGGTIYVSAGGTLNLQGGTITGGQATAGTGGNIYVEAGATAGCVNMYGGTVTGGKAKQGGNIYLAAGSSTKAAGALNLYGGTISSGTGTTTAGNVAALGAMTMSGGEITGGVGPASGNHMYAYNVYTLPGKNGCTFTMTGGTITGGVRVNNAGVITLGGTAKITGSTNATGLTFSAGSMTTTGFSAGAEVSINSTAYGEANSFGTGVAGDEAYIHGDNGSTAAITEVGKLYLVDPAASASVEAEQEG